MDEILTGFQTEIGETEFAGFPVLLRMQGTETHFGGLLARRFHDRQGKSRANSDGFIGGELKG